ncbi:MAG: hypothetical protein ACE15E_14090 [Acidobacteriota bacterium]
MWHASEITHDAEDDEAGNEIKELVVMQPAEGEYVLSVVGTGTGTYDLDIRMNEIDGQASRGVFEKIPIGPGIVHKYAFDFSGDPAARIKVRGGFDGKGQRPDDVNKLLTYCAPGERSTTLAAGVSEYTLIIRYGENIIPSTLNVGLNGTPLTFLFSPAPGKKRNHSDLSRKGSQHPQAERRRESRRENCG